MVAAVLHNRLLLRFTALVCMVLIALQVELLTAMRALAADTTPTTDYSHTAPEYLLPGARTTITAKITDPKGIKLARCYFRIAGEADYLFVPMQQGPGNTYSAILPAFNAATRVLQYRLLAVNTEGEATQTAEFSVPTGHGGAVVPPWQHTVRTGALPVATESEIRSTGRSRKGAGFSDTMILRLAEPQDRLFMNAVEVSGPTVKATAHHAQPAPQADPQPVQTVKSAHPEIVQAPAAPTVIDKKLLPEPARSEMTHERLSSKATQTSAETRPVSSDKILGMKSSTFWWIVGGLAVIAIGAGVAAASGGGGGSSAVTTGTVRTDWSGGAPATGTVTTQWK